MTDKYVLPITIRPLQETDVHWVVNSWVTSQVVDNTRRLERDRSSTRRRSYHYNEDMAWVSLSLLAKEAICNYRTLMAVNPEDEDQIFGYVVYRDDVLLWIYTKMPFRETHVATRLMEAAFPGFPDVTTRITTVTYAISHQRDSWNLQIDQRAIRDLLL